MAIMKEIETAEDFQERFCENCLVCKTHKSYPWFCFEVLFKDEPLVFENQIYPELLSLDEWDIDLEDAEEVFSRVFCNPETCKYAEISDPSGIMANKCSKIQECMEAFSKQIEDDSYVTGDDVDVDETTDLSDKDVDELDLSDIDYDDYSSGMGRYNERRYNNRKKSKENKKTNYQDDDYFLINHGCTRREYMENYCGDYCDTRVYKAPNSYYSTFQKSKPKIVTFRNKSAEWNKIIKKILG